MKTHFRLSVIVVILFLIFSGCGKNKNRLPIVTTSVFNTGIREASCSGVLYAEGDAKVTEKGICWRKEGAPDVYSNKVICESAEQNFTGAITGLDPETQYYARAYAINEFGVVYGKVISFKTLSVYFPSLSLTRFTTPTTNSVQLLFDLTQQMPAAFITGICWSETPVPTILSNTLAAIERKMTDQVPYYNSVFITLKDLKPGTTYYARAFSTGLLGTIYSNEISWSTATQLNPVTFSLRSVEHTKADFNLNVGYIDPSDVQAVGICWSEIPSPTTSDNTKERPYTSSAVITIDPLNSNSTYFARAYVITNGKTIYSQQELSLRTLKSTVTDVDGNVYNTVEIGGVEWMASNYRASSFNNGTTIPQVKPNANYNQWVNNVNAQNPVYCYYADNSSYDNTLGKLYPKYVAQSPNFPPTGWRLPAASDWEALTASTNNIAELCLANGSWQSPLITNAYGFSLYAAGYWDSGFGNMGTQSRFWVAALTSSISEKNTYLFSSYNSASVTWYQSGDAQSVRFVKQ